MSVPDSCLQQAFSSVHLPLLEEAIVALYALVQSEGASPVRVLGQPTPKAWMEGAGSIAYLCETGRLSSETVASTAAGIAEASLTPVQALERHFLPHVLLAAATPMSLQPAKDPPPTWLVRSVQAMIAVDAAEPLLDPQIADDWLDGAPGCLTLPWLGRETLPARWLSRRMTPKKFWQAVGQAQFWQTPALAAWLAEAETIARTGVWPDVTDAPVEDDLFAFSDAWHAMTAVRVRQHGAPVTVAQVPHGGGLVWNVASSTLAARGGPVSVTRAAQLGYLEPPVAQLGVPVPLSAGLRALGWRDVVLHLDDADAADELLDAVLDLALDPIAPQTLEGPGFSIEPVPHP